MPPVAQEYLDRLNALMEQLGSSIFNDVNLECGHFFSGAAVYARGRICMSWTPVGFAIKLPEASRSILLQQHHATPLRYFPKGPRQKRLRRFARIHVERYENTSTLGESKCRVRGLTANARKENEKPYHTSFNRTRQTAPRRLTLRCVRRTDVRGGGIERP